MKYIHKTYAPEEYLIWCQTQERLGTNYDYKSLQNPEKESLLNALLTEQGFICGYTMKRIEKDTTHIEHIKPRHICVQEGQGLDLDYFNLIACFPRKGMKSTCRYGAQAKDNWWENGGNEFLSPLKDICELRVIFNLKGEISPTNNHRSSTLKTISVLKLDDLILTDDRMKSIQEFIYGDNGEQPISPEDANKAIDEIYKPNPNGILHEFCIAIHDALYEYIDIIKNISKNAN